MKLVWKLAIVAGVLLAMNSVNVARATLIDRGNGLIYDADMDITWLQDSRFAITSGYDDGYMTQQEALDWVNALDYAGHDRWRLPTALNVNGQEPGSHFNWTEGELGHLFFVELGNTGYPNPGWGLMNSGPFINLTDVNGYWTSTLWSGSSTNAWVMSFGNGNQYPDFLSYWANWAWAVHDGDIGANPVPEPATMLLLGTGIAGLAGFRFKREKQQTA